MTSEEEDKMLGLTMDDCDDADGISNDNDDFISKVAAAGVAFCLEEQFFIVTVVTLSFYCFCVICSFLSKHCFCFDWIHRLHPLQ